MAVADEDVAVGRDEDGGGRVELVGACAGDASLTERQQELAVGTELEDLMALAVLADAVGQPDIAFAIDMQAVRKDGQAGAEALHQPPDASNFRIGSSLEPAQSKGWPSCHLANGSKALHAATFADPDARAVGIDIDRAGRAPGAAFGQFCPVLDRTIAIGQRIGRRYACKASVPNTAMAATASPSIWCVRS